MLKKIIYKILIHLIVPIYSLFILRKKDLIKLYYSKLISEEEKIIFYNNQYYIHGDISFSFLKIKSFTLKKNWII